MKTNSHFITLSGFFVLIGICLAVTTTLLNNGSKVEARTNLAPNLQQPSTPTPQPSCAVPPYPAAVYGRNPYPTEIAPYFTQAGLNRLTTSGPTLPTLTPNQSPYTPCILLQAMAYQESDWRHFDADYNNFGYTKISPACAYGLTQVVSGMTGGGGFDQNRTNQEIAYNLGVGTLTLITKWNALKLTSGGFPGGAYIVGDGNPQIAEDWYYAVWAYFGWGWGNNPNNNCANWTPTCGGWFAARPPFNPSDTTQNVRWYPYQELIWGYAAHPPTYNSIPLWQAVNLSLPNRTNVGGITDPNHYPNANLPRPAPYHGSCSATYLPIILKNWIGLNCTNFTQTWYPVGTNTCNASVPNCADGDGQPDGVFAGPWAVGYHQVEFSPQLILPQTMVATYWKSISGNYGNLYIDAKVNNEWVRIDISTGQSAYPGMWTQMAAGQHADKYISGLRFGFSYTLGPPGGDAHQFMVDGYRITNFITCTP